MTFSDWQALSPAAAARELHRRVRDLLPAAQQRATIASLRTEAQLAGAFAHCHRAAPLGGVPVFVKDLFDQAGAPTAAGSTFLPEVQPTPRQDSAIIRALHTAGAVVAGKTHLHEFAYGITGENSHFGDCEHPHFPGRTSGGSSSGSAAAVAAGIVPFAIGTDTGGSIRVPAAFCGLFGFRLTPRDTLIADAVPLAPSFDTAGWFTANAADMLTAVQTLVRVIEMRYPSMGHPGEIGVTRSVRSGTTRSPTFVDASTSGASPRGCYLQMPGLDSDIAAACREAAARFAAPADEATRTALLDGFIPALDTYNRIVAAEAWTVHAPWFDRYRSRYDPAVARRLEHARALSSAEVISARADAATIQTTWSAYFRSFDFLVLPAVPFGALTKAECTLENRSRLLRLTAPASVGGLPVLTIPVPLPSGLTAGLQIIAREPNSPVFPWALSR